MDFKVDLCTLLMLKFITRLCHRANVYRHKCRDLDNFNFESMRISFVWCCISIEPDMVALANSVCVLNLSSDSCLLYSKTTLKRSCGL